MIHNSGILAANNARRLRMNQERLRKQSEKRQRELLEKQKKDRAKIQKDLEGLTGEAFIYNPEDGKTSMITKDIYVGLLQRCLKVEASIYINKTYSQIITDLAITKPLLKQFSPKMYSFTTDDNLIVVCSIDKTLEDFKTYCRNNNLKLFGEEKQEYNFYKAIMSMNFGGWSKVFDTYEKAEAWLNSQFHDGRTWQKVEGFSIQGIKGMPDDILQKYIEDLATTFIDDQYKTNPKQGINREINELNLSYAGVIQDSIKTQYKIDIPLLKIKQMLKKQFDIMLQKL